MSQPFDSVRERILRAGIAPRHARRYITELREHLADLTAKERAAGHGAQEAAVRARAMLGSDEELAQAMTARREFRSVAARAPWAVFGLLPVLLFMAVIWAIAISMMHLLWPVAGMAPADMPESYASLIAAVSFVASYLLGPALAVGCIMLALRQRLTSRWVWIGLGLIAVFSGLLGFHMHVVPPEGGHKGGMLFSLADVVHLHGRVNLAATFGVAALRAAVLFAMAATAYRALRMRIMAVSPI